MSKWTGLLQISGYTGDGRRMRRTGYVQDLRKAKATRFITKEPGGVLPGNWAPRWVCQLLEWAPGVWGSRGTYERFQRQNTRWAWLKAVLPAVEQDIDTNMAAVSSIRRLACPDPGPHTYNQNQHLKRAAAVLSWAQGQRGG